MSLQHFIACSYLLCKLALCLLEYGLNVKVYSLVTLIMVHMRSFTICSDLVLQDPEGAVVIVRFPEGPIGAASPLVRRLDFRKYNDM